MSASRAGVVAAVSDGSSPAPREAVRPQVALRLERDASGRTFLARKFSTYPFFCAAPFHLDRTPRGMLTAIIQSSSGGLYEDDRLALSIDVGAGAEAHVTTQGATLAHPMPHGGQAEHRVQIRAAAGSLVEYLPEPLILLPTASVRTSVEIVADPGSTVVVGDAFLTHDPAAGGRPFRRLLVETTFRHRDAAPFAIERFDVTGDAAEAAWRRLTPYPLGAQGSLWISAPGAPGALTATLGDALAGVPGLHAAASALPDGAGAVARLLAADARVLGDGFRTAWHALRRALTGLPPASRRQSGWLS